jgi:hypothetical protein
LVAFEDEGMTEEGTGDCLRANAENGSGHDGKPFGRVRASALQERMCEVSDSRAMHKRESPTEVCCSGFLRLPSATRQSLLAPAQAKNSRSGVWRLTALRPCLAAGLPLSRTIVALQKINAADARVRTSHSDIMN